MEKLILEILLLTLLLALSAALLLYGRPPSGNPTRVTIYPGGRIETEEVPVYELGGNPTRVTIYPNGHTEAEELPVYELR